MDSPHTQFPYMDLLYVYTIIFCYVIFVLLSSLYFIWLTYHIPQCIWRNSVNVGLFPPCYGRNSTFLVYVVLPYILFFILYPLLVPVPMSLTTLSMFVNLISCICHALIVMNIYWFKLLYSRHTYK